jgi:hypothetical protein
MKELVKATASHPAFLAYGPMGLVEATKRASAADMLCRLFNGMAAPA